MPTPTVPELLCQAAAIYEERNATYGDNYKKFGKWAAPLLGDEFTLSGADDFTRFGILLQILSKLSRYAEAFNDGGHDDSLCDLSVYANMLRELDNEIEVEGGTRSFTVPPTPTTKSHDHI